MAIQFYNIATADRTLLAEFDDHYNLKFLHPTLKYVIDKEKGVSLPVIKKLTEQFGIGEGARVSPDNKLFGKALVIHLQFSYASHPETYKWLNGEELVKAAVSGKK